MKAKVIRTFRGARDGSRKTETFNPGDQVDGELGDAMVRAGYAEATSISRARTAKSDGPEKPVGSGATVSKGESPNVVRRGSGTGRKRKQSTKK